MNVWKIGSRWSDDGSEGSSIIDIFRKYNIVFAGRQTDYIQQVKINDLIAVSDGLTVVSVGVVLGEPLPITKFEFDKKDLKEKRFDYENWVLGFKVKLYDLDKKEYFNYNRGTFHKIHDTYRDIVVKLYNQKKEKKDLINIEDENELKTCLIDICVENFQGIKKINILEIPTNTQWIFLTGINGFGKTSMLRAIMVGLQGEGVLSLSDKNLPEGTKIKFKSIKFPNNFHKNIIGDETFIKFSDFENLCAYGTIRTYLKDTKDVSEIHENLFENENEKYKLINFEIRYKDWKLFSEKNKTKIQNFEKLLKLLLPNLSKIDISENNSEVVYYELSETNEELPPVTFYKLGMGMRSIIAMISDLIFRFTKETFDFEIENDRINLSGIVIIDELDNHLHPKWQRDFVKKLTDIFPKIQFIVSTHSPIPLLGAPPERTVILNVNRTKEEGIIVRRLEKLEKELKYLLPNQLLTSDIFGLEEIENVYLDDNEFDRIALEDKYEDIEKNKALFEDLEQRANNKELFPDDLFKDKIL